MKSEELSGTPHPHRMCSDYDCAPQGACFIALKFVRHCDQETPPFVTFEDKFAAAGRRWTVYTLREECEI